MHFEMFTEHEVELFALHTSFFNLNEFSFQFVCSTLIKFTKKVAFWGHFLVLCTARSLELLGALPPGPTGGLIAAPTQPAAPGNEIRSLHIVLPAGYHCHPCMPSRQIWPTTLNSFKKGLK